MQRLDKKLSESVSVINVKRLTCVLPGRSNENYAAVRSYVAECPTTSIRHRAEEIGVSRSTINFFFET